MLRDVKRSKTLVKRHVAFYLYRKLEADRAGELLLTSRSSAIGQGCLGDPTLHSWQAEVLGVFLPERGQIGGNSPRFSELVSGCS